MAQLFPTHMPLRLLRRYNISQAIPGTLKLQCNHSQQRNASILGALSDIPSSYNKRIRVGRGPSSGYGKTSGRGHKGQKQHGKVPLGFEGGQTPVEKIKGKRGFINVHSKEFTVVPLTRIQSWVAQGRLAADRPITPRELIISRCVSDAKDGIKLLARSMTHDNSLDAQGPLTIPLNIVVSRASSSAIKAVEKAGGTVMTRYYTKWAMEQIVEGKMDPLQSLRSESEEGADAAQEANGYIYRLPDATSRKAIEYYRDAAHRGYLAHTVGQYEGPSLYHKPPRKITKEEIEERRRRRGTSGQSTKQKLSTGDGNRVW